MAGTGEMRPIGVIIGGSLSEGLQMKVSDQVSVEDLRAGRFMVVEGEKYRFFCLLTDVVLETSDRRFMLFPPATGDTLARQVLQGTGAYAIATLRPTLMRSNGAPAEFDAGSLLPVKTIMPHFCAVYPANPDDVAQVFGKKDDQRFYHIGSPLEMEETPLCLNMERFIERSSGVFGKSGTGKTFLTRIILCGLIQSQQISSLIFDMHNEYGFRGTTEERNRSGGVRGLKQFFPDRVKVYSLDPESSKNRRVTPDAIVRIPIKDVTVEDIMLLAGELNLGGTALETCIQLENRLGENWLADFLEKESDDIVDLSRQNVGHQGALNALQRKLRSFEHRCSDFLKREVAKQESGIIEELFSDLNHGKHVVLEFGRHRDPLQYMLVANILTRKIHERYREETEKAMEGDQPGPRPLVIVIEEAHKFLSPELSDQTIFGTIAREMRKYHVTLMVVDQRPSGIDDEILSQIGTRAVCLLDDERDVNAVLQGTPSSSGLRAVLAGLESKQQALIFGHAMPMPIVIRSRTYDDENFRKAFHLEAPEERKQRLDKEISSDYG